LSKRYLVLFEDRDIQLYHICNMKYIWICRYSFVNDIYYRHNMSLFIFLYICVIFADWVAEIYYDTIMSIITKMSYHHISRLSFI